MSIHRINEIGRADGYEAALAYAIRSMAPYHVRNAIENQTWSFYGKSAAQPVTPAPRHVETPAIFRPARRIGKTAKSGGLAAAQKRKRENAEKDRQLRAIMKGASNGGGEKKGKGKK